MFDVIILDLHGILIKKFPLAEYERKVKELLRNNNYKNKYEFDNWKTEYGTITQAMEEHKLKKQYLNVLNSLSVIKQEDKELINLLNEAKKKFTLYIATDTTKKNALRTLRAAKISTTFFKDIITANDVQKGKPAPGLYKAILKAEVKMPDRFIVVGDRITDIIPAAKLGMYGLMCDYENFKIFLNGWLNASIKVCGKDSAV